MEYKSSKSIKTSFIKQEFTQDPFAYKIALLSFLSNAMSAAMSTTLSPLSAILAQNFKFSEATIWYLNSVFTLYFLLFNSFANYLIDKIGIKTSMLVGVFLTVTGAWIRVGLNTSLSYSVLTIGQTIMAIGGPFMLNSISKISNKWFLPQNRTKMTSMMSSAYMFGLGSGFFITSLLWDYEPDGVKSAKNSIEKLMTTSAVFCTALAIPVVLYFKEAPDLAPSLSSNSEREDFVSSLKILSQNKDYKILFSVFSFALGNFITMIFMIHHIVTPFNYTIHQISNIGLIINFTSGFSKCIIAFIAPHFKFRKVICSILIAICVSTLAYMYALSNGNIIIVYFSSVLFGFFCQMYWGPALEYACEITFPVSESQAAGNLIFGGSVVGLITNSLISSLYGFVDPIFFLFYLIISYTACAVAVNMMSDELKRENFEMKILKINL